MKGAYFKVVSLSYCQAELSNCNCSQTRRPPLWKSPLLNFLVNASYQFGYNVTVICTSNTSKQNHGDQGAGQPFWIKYFSPKIYDYCGGQKKDAEDSKRCKFLIRNATKNDSGDYKCKSENQITCTEGTLNLTFTGNVCHSTPW